MLHQLLKLRYVFLLAVGVTFVNSIILIVLGCVRAFEGIILFGQVTFNHTEGRPGVLILESLDLFLVAFVFMIFSLGMAKIFIFNNREEKDLPSWLNFTQFVELKMLLWETVIVTLVVYSLTNLIKMETALTWDALIFPLIVLILTIGYWLMKKSH